MFAPGEIGFLLSKEGYQFSIDPTNPESIQAVKGTSQIYLDGSRRVFGARSDTVQNSISAVGELYSIVKTGLQIDIAKYVKFYEFELNATYFAGEDVYAKFVNLYKDSVDLVTLKEILGGEYSQANLKLASSGRNINSAEWYEITIEPKVNSVRKTLAIRLICRNPKLNKLTEVKKKFELLLRALF